MSGNSSQRPALSFVLAGFAKCGSTTVWSLLNDHPDLFLARGSVLMKETNFFSELWNHGWGWYASLFSDAPAHALLGEASNSYSNKRNVDQVLDRLLDLAPEIRVLFVVRDPVARIESALRHLAHFGAGRVTPEKAIDLEPVLKRHPTLLEASRYHERLQPYEKRLGKDRVHAVFLEDIMDDAQTALRGCFQFLGVDENATLPNPSRHLHNGKDRCFDTPQLRELRRDSAAGAALRRISTHVQDQFLCPLGLRRSFAEQDLSLSREQRVALAGAVQEDALRFLREVGRPLSTWPLLASHLDADPDGLTRAGSAACR